MKVMLIQPPSAYHRETYPLSLAYLGAVLERAGCEVKAIDASALNCFMDVNDIAEEVKKFSPDFVGITLIINLIEHGYPLAFEISKLGIPVVAGGPHVKLCTHEVLANNFDIAVRGEGEATILDLVEYFKAKKDLKDINGISYKDASGRIIDNPDRAFIEELDNLPYPARHLFPVSDYSSAEIQDDGAYWTILTSRGCPRRCIYCVSIHGSFGGRYRFRSAKSVYDELVHLKKNHNVSRVKFYDDTFTINKNRVNDICDFLIKDKGLGIQWSCDSRVDCVSEELILKMKEAGCYHIYYGIESFDEETLANIKKGITTEMIRQAVDWTIKAKLDFTMYLILGWPWENRSHVGKTLKFIESIPLDVKCKYSYFVPIPYPKTELYEANHKKYGFTEWWLKENAFEKFYEDKGYVPYFRLNMPFIDHFYLKKNFFGHERGFQHFLKKVFCRMGKAEMKRLYGGFKGSIVISLSYLSFFLYRINPEAEKTIFRLLWSENIRGKAKKMLGI